MDVQMESEATQHMELEAIQEPEPETEASSRLYTRRAKEASSVCRAVSLPPSPFTVWPPAFSKSTPSHVSEAMLKRPHLCLVTDPERPNLIQKVEQALTAGITMLQLRSQTLSSARLYALASVLRPLCQQYQAVFIVNDRVDIGLAIGADGFQLGGHSLPIPVARQLVGERYLLGASVHTPEAACAAVTAGADFLLVGTIFASPSHPGGPTSGPQLVRTLRRLGLSLPLLAIGGITSANAQQVMQAGADGIAVISAILDAPNIGQAVRDLYMSITCEDKKRL